MASEAEAARIHRKAANGLRLYVAGSTPNSVRARHNLTLAIAAASSAPETIRLEVIDVFTDPRRALTDGVLVTPTLIGVSPRGRTTIMGDLTDSEPLRRLLAQLASSLDPG